MKVNLSCCLSCSVIFVLMSFLASFWNVADCSDRHFTHLLWAEDFISSIVSDEEILLSDCYSRLVLFRTLFCLCFVGKVSVVSKVMEEGRRGLQPLFKPYVLSIIITMHSNNGINCVDTEQHMKNSIWRWTWKADEVQMTAVSSAS